MSGIRGIPPGGSIPRPLRYFHTWKDGLPSRRRRLTTPPKRDENLLHVLSGKLKEAQDELTEVEAFACVGTPVEPSYLKGLQARAHRLEKEVRICLS